MQLSHSIVYRTIVDVVLFTYRLVSLFTWGSIGRRFDGHRQRVSLLQAQCVSVGLFRRTYLGGTPCIPRDTSLRISEIALPRAASRTVLM